MEGLLQSIKWDCPETQKEVCLLVGVKAKRKGYGQDWWTEQTLFWQGTPIGRHSDQYQSLLDEMFVSLYSQNLQARQTLIDTGDEVLTHKIGKSDPSATILTEKEFCTRLMDIRTFYHSKDLVTF